MNSSDCPEKAEAVKVNLDSQGATDCAKSRRGFLSRVGTAGLATSALSLTGADFYGLYKPKKSAASKSRSKTQATPDTSRSQKKGPSLPSLYSGSNARNFEEILEDEAAHVQFLVSNLGSAARPKPNFQNLLQPNVTTFAWAARNFENTGVAAYLGALPGLVGTPYLAAAAGIALIEARHSGYLNVLLNLSITENIAGIVTSIEGPLTPEQVVQNITPYVVDLNGGPPLIPSGGLSQPVDILNFALALEYLESEYYNLNVPRFFS